MKSSTSLSSKLIRTGTGFLVVALASIGLSLWLTWQMEGGGAAINEAGRMRMQTWRLSSMVQADLAPAKVQSLVSNFDQSLTLLQRGDPLRPLFVPWDDAVRTKFAAVENLWALQRSQWLSPETLSPQDSLQSAGIFVEAIDRFVQSIERQMSRLTAILNLVQFFMMALAVGGAGVMLYTGYLYVISPLTKLRQGLHMIESGDFTTRVEVEALDEFGQVEAGFNGMAQRLQSLYEGLEAQVKAKTRDLEGQKTRIETLYEVSAFLASADSIEALSKGFAQRVRSVMKADAVVVRWSDEANQRYLMLASDCFPSDMIDDERSLLTGACACGSLAPDSRTRVIPIHNHEVAPLRRCARAGYESLVSVPMRLQNRLIGEVDLFFRNTVVLRADEVELLDSLASHLASAMEGLRAAALEREAAVGEERALLASELHDSIAQSLAFLKIQVQLLRGATQKARPVQVQTALDELDAGLRESINDVRELLVHFRTRTNTDNIENALQETLQKFRHQTGLPAQLHVQGEGLPLPSDVQVQVLHVVQEALSNVRKHAGATTVELEVFKGECWRFVVRDDGIGFDADMVRNETHVGLKIMRERASSVGAQVTVASQPGEGSTVTLILPAHPVMAAREAILVNG